MSAEDRFVIVGGGRAAAFAAEELRERGFDGAIRVVAAEHHLPYDHPPLSKDYLQGGGLDDVFLHPEGWYREHDVQLQTGVTAEALDTVNHLLTLSTGQEVGYDRLLLATGARARAAGLPGEGAAYTLRTLDDGKRLREALRSGGRTVAVIGSGWIGMEVAASARTMGNEVTVLGHGAVPLSSAVGAELGSYLRGVQEGHGVVFRMDAAVAGVSGSGVELGGGETIAAEVVVVAVGAEPNVELAKAAGLEVGDGVMTDPSLQTSAADVFAAGDVANAFHPILGARLRTEHWANASGQAAVAARSMLGEKAVFDAIPYFFTDQFELGMEYSGFPALTEGARIVYRGDRDSGEFIAFWVDEGDHLVAGTNVNVWDVNERVQELIGSGRPLDLVALADPAVDLASL